MINLIEYDYWGKEIDKENITEDDRVFLNKLQYEDLKNYPSRFNIVENKSTLTIKPLNYVGVIQLSKERINIVPRFDNGFEGLIQMIGFSKGIDYKYYKAKVDSSIDANNLYEIIVELLIIEIEMILKNGIFHEYVKCSENLKVLRGRIDMRNQITKNFLQGSKIYCNHDSLDTDVIENQIILSALDISSKTIKNKKLKDKVNKYKSMFSGLCDKYTNKNIGEIRYNRLNSYYEQVHFYSKIIIESLGVSDIYKGKNSSCYGLLIDMNELFELFVSRLFTEFLPSNYKVKSQIKITDAIVDKNKNRYRDIKPDIYIENKETKQVTIIDTKNKNYGSKKVLNEDIYQLSFYGMYFYDMFRETANISIIYPKYEENLNQDNKIYLNTYKSLDENIYLNVKGIDICEFLVLLKDKRENRELIQQRLVEKYIM